MAERWSGRLRYLPIRARKTYSSKGGHLPGDPIDVLFDGKEILVHKEAENRSAGARDWLRPVIPHAFLYCTWLSAERSIRPKPSMKWRNS